MMMRTLTKIVALSCCFASILSAAEWNDQQRASLLHYAQKVESDPQAASILPKYSPDKLSSPEWAAEVPALLRQIAETGDVSLRSPSGFNALQVACLYADETAVQMLLDAGADVNARPAEWKKLKLAGNSPLGMVVYYIDEKSYSTRYRIAQLLLCAGAGPDAPIMSWGEISPFCAVRGFAPDDELRLLLLSYGNQNLKERTKNWKLAWRWYDKELIRKLLDAGVDPNSSVGEKGFTLLAQLLYEGADADFVKFVLDKGASVVASPETKHYLNHYPFMINVRSTADADNAVAVLRLLLDAGCSIDSLNNAGESLRIHYGKYDTPAARAIGEELRARGAKLHPDAPKRKKKK